MSRTESQLAIRCDSCDAPGAAQRCSRCMLVLYCNGDCQKTHWKEHKKTCAAGASAAEEFRKEQKWLNKAMLDDGNEKKPAAEADVCGVCLEVLGETGKVVTLGCKHRFCYECMGQYQRHALSVGEDTRCPLCRSGLPADLLQDMRTEACLESVRAMKFPKGDPQRAKRLATAGEKMDAALAMEPKSIPLRLSRAEIFVHQGDQVRAVEVLQDLVPDVTQPEGRDYLGRVITNLREVERKVHLCLGKCYHDIGQWKLANTAFLRCFEVVRTHHCGDHEEGKDVRNLLQWLARVAYELGEYDRAVDLGHAAIAQNRHFGGVHWYVALAHKARGELDSAVTLMHQAVMYENPWDEEHTKSIKAKLNLLLVEKNKGAASAAAVVAGARKDGTIRAIFVYGTLRPDFSETGDRWGATGGCKWRRASVSHHKIYQDPALTYPFAVHTGEAADVVRGTLIWYDDDNENNTKFRSLVARCNSIEDYEEGCTGGLYERAVVKVTLDTSDGTDAPAWSTDEGPSPTVEAYMYYQATPSPERLAACLAFPGGDWLAKAGGRQ